MSALPRAFETGLHQIRLPPLKGSIERSTRLGENIFWDKFSDTVQRFLNFFGLSHSFSSMFSFWGAVGWVGGEMFKPRFLFSETTFSILAFERSVGNSGISQHRRNSDARQKHRSNCIIYVYTPYSNNTKQIKA